jgi:hypothetical protein
VLIANQDQCPEILTLAKCACRMWQKLGERDLDIILDGILRFDRQTDIEADIEAVSGIG